MACNMRTDLLISQICPTSGHVSVQRRIGNASVVRAVVVDHNTLFKDIIGSTRSLIMRRPTLPKPQLVEETDHERKGCKGKFGRFGGNFVPETLISCLSDLEAEFNLVLHDAQFQAELATALRDYVGRETPLYFAERLTNHYKKNNNGEGPDIYLKREDLNHGGAHKINNAIAQAMIAKRLGRKSVVAATGAGQHGVATAAACAKLSLQCTIFMGTKDMEKQSSNLVLMKLLGAENNDYTMHSAERLHNTIEICGGLTQETTLRFHPFARMGLLEGFLSLFGTLGFRFKSTCLKCTQGKYSRQPQAYAFRWATGS